MLGDRDYQVESKDCEYWEYRLLWSGDPDALNGQPSEGRKVYLERGWHFFSALREVDEVDAIETKVIRSKAYF